MALAVFSRRTFAECCSLSRVDVSQELTAMFLHHVRELPHACIRRLVKTASDLWGQGTWDRELGAANWDRGQGTGPPQVLCDNFKQRREE